MSRGMGKREREIIDIIKGRVIYQGKLREEFRSRPHSERVSMERAYRSLKANGALSFEKENHPGPFGLSFNPTVVSVADSRAGGKIDNT